MHHYDLDPAHFLYGMSRDALLKKIKFELELMTNIYMGLFMEKSQVVGSQWYQKD